MATSLQLALLVKLPSLLAVDGCNRWLNIKGWNGTIANFWNFCLEEIKLSRNNISKFNTQLKKKFYRMNTSTPKIHMLKSNAQHDDIWQWDFWEVGYVMRVEPSSIGLMPLWISTPESSLFFSPCETTGNKQSSMIQEMGPHNTLNLPALILDFPELWEIHICYLTHLFYGIFVIQPKQTKREIGSKKWKVAVTNV